LINLFCVTNNSFFTAAKTPRDIADAGTKLESLNIAQTTSVNVQERIIKATAQGGLLSLSMRLLENILSVSEAVPSYMAYTALLNGLRRSGRIQDMESVLKKLAEACQSNKGTESDGIDVIAFNTYVAALCDAAAEAYESSRPRRLQSTAPINEEVADADCRSFRDFLSDAVSLLEPGVAKKRFCVASNPDLVPYNTILACAARTKQPSVADQVLELMHRNGFQGDIYTYNARIRLAMTTRDDTNADDNEALRLVEEVISSPNLQPDMYTIDLALVPLVQAGKMGDVLELLSEFEALKAVDGFGRSRYIDALGCFLTTLVKANELEFAKLLFDSYVLPLIPEKPPNPGESLPQVDSKSERVPIGKIKTAESRRLAAFTTHFNTMIEGYRRLNSYLDEHSIDDDDDDDDKFADEDAPLSANRRKSAADPRQSALDLFDLMIARGICPDAYTITSMAGLQKNSVGLSKLWARAINEFQLRMTPIMYNAFITAYGKVGDPSSAAWAFYKFLSIQSQGGRRKSWNIFLGSLSNGSRKRGADKIDVFSSVAALGLEDVLDEPVRRGGTNNDSESKAAAIMSQIEGMDCAQAARYILDEMAALEAFPSPDSQSFCLVATAMFHVGKGSDDAIQLFRDALESRIAPDGRLVNACIRCYGDQIDKALLAWKNQIRSAVLAHENRKRPRSSTSLFPKKRKKNLAAAYNGLLYVCGKAGRPDIALRLAYAMNKEGVEPNETSYNSYIKGKEDRSQGETAMMRILANQHESLLQVECMKYDTRDKRRENEKRIRIIL